MGLTPNSAILHYFCCWFSSLDLATFSDGSNVPQINNKDILPIPVPLPAIVEQQRIVAEAERRLSVVEELEAVVNANLQRATRSVKRFCSGRLLASSPESCKYI
jgi:type I restriction enzyme, S subunit